MNDKIKGLIVGITIGFLLTASTAFASNSTSIKAVIHKINIYVDGTKKTNTDAITYKGSVYVPIRILGNSIGKQVGLNGENIYIGKQPVTQITDDKAIKIVYNKIKKEADKYHLHFMIESDATSNKITVHAFEDFPDHIATYGWYYVDRTTGKTTKMDMLTGDEVNL
ncbi:hypothetical protein Back11_56550 [Paenibacillus baekrokdamisoli]|uniref:Uncharacterized protein n=1 Tax=Paenibacillus baekrokdamisoli TaxID=1712516 RepID=A0A3G9IZI6_9BACL|nr:stalk domain-containing protein [Paenibacillus baekrokdamisoli]MBB3073183.1 hypothetical protein [Paenibacillus baekrokdamisoli]BBH24310.1 hypothetical protein Back11_56550 [Paenibacillus baekrokdamisoli]